MTDITGTNKERYDKNIRRREKLSGYYFDMSKLVFAATALTNIDVFKGNGRLVDFVIVAIGVLLTYVLAYIANQSLNF